MATKKKQEPTSPPAEKEPASPEQLEKIGKLLGSKKVTREAANTIIEEVALDQEDGGKTIRRELRFQLEAKEALLFHLWKYANSPGNTPEQKEDILRTTRILDGGIKVLKLENVQLTDGPGIRWKQTITSPRNTDRKVIEEHMGTPWVQLAVAEMFGLGEQFLQAMRRPEAPAFIKQGTHLTKNFLGPDKGQLKIDFTQKLEQYTQETGLTMNNRPEGFGLDLNVVQQETLHAILGAFSNEEYRGHITLPKEDALTDPKLEAGSYQVGKVRAAGPEADHRRAWANIAQVPEIRLSLADIVRLAGYDHERQGDKQKVKEAVEHLSRTLYAFYWKRKAWKIAKGQIVGPDLGKDGEQKLEEVMEYGPILRVKQITDDQTKQLKYFEISPSAVVLDQVNPTYGGNYFLMVPGDLHAKVKKAVKGGKRANSFYYVFLLYLMDHYEQYRRHHNHERGLTIRKPWEEIAQRLRMPETVWRRNKVKALERLETIYQVAKELGYLKSYRMGKDGVVTLELDPQAYYHPKKELQEAGTEAEKG